MDAAEIFGGSAAASTPLPGADWSINAEEKHVFSMELARLFGYLDTDMLGAEYWLCVVESAPARFNSTPELFAFAEAHVAAARRHLSLLFRLDNPSEPVVLEACGHTAQEHLQVLDTWYNRNIGDAKRYLATLIRFWNLLPEAKMPGKPYMARCDMERDIEDHIAMLRQDEWHGRTDNELYDQLITVIGMSPDEADVRLEQIRQARFRQHRELLREKYERDYRILE